MPGLEGYEQVRVTSRSELVWLLVVRSVIAGVTAFAGALATVTIGGEGIAPQQWWAAIAAGGAAVGMQAGITERGANSYAPKGELEKIKQGRDIHTTGKHDMKAGNDD